MQTLTPSKRSQEFLAKSAKLAKGKSGFVWSYNDFSNLTFSARRDSSDKRIPLTPLVTEDPFFRKDDRTRGVSANSYFLAK
jgi:hypothetical protein